MRFTVDTLPTLEVAEERLVAAIGAAQLEQQDRVNVLVGSNLQRLYFRRLLAQALGPTANIRFFTPIDLAVTIRQLAPTPPRRPLPDGAQAILLDGIVRRLANEQTVRRLDPDVQGLAPALAASLSDLREAAIAPDEFAGVVRRAGDEKQRELGTIYAAFEESMRAFADRPALYADALDPLVPIDTLREALGGAPLFVTGLYDAPAVQVALIARCAEAVDVALHLVATPEPEFAFARAFGAALESAGATTVAIDEPGDEFAAGPARAFFSAPSRQAEAEEVVRRTLALARTHGVRFHEVAVLHRLDDNADDLIAAAFDRAGVPVYRASGQPLRHTAPGRAALVLLDLMLQPAPQRQLLLEFLANPALRRELPPGARITPLLWERISKQAGMVRGWERFSQQLQEHVATLKADERFDREYGIETTEALAAVVDTLAAHAAQPDTLPDWSAYTKWFDGLLEAYLAPPVGERGPTTALRDRVRALAQLDRMDLRVDRDRFRLAAEQAIRRAVLTDRQPLARGVFVGNVSAARSLRFEAVFLVEAAERIFPPLIRQDPLLLDHERERINADLRRPALPLKRDRLFEERLLFRLVEQSARRFLTISWARRTNTTGAPKRPSSLLLRSIEGEIDELATVEELYEQGAIIKLPTRLAGAAPSRAEVEAGEWDATDRALDGSDFRLALLEAAPLVAKDLLAPLWAGYERYARARRGRNEGRFGEWDGVIDPATIAQPPLQRPTSATALESYATCPYRYFLRQVLHVRAVTAPGEALEMSPLDRGSMVHAILERWVRTALESEADWAAFVADEERLIQIAEEEFERSGRGGLVGLPATWAIVRGEVINDLRQLIKIEQERAAAGHRPVAVEEPFEDLVLETPQGSSLTLRGRIDRVDARPGGYVAIDYKTGRASKEGTDYRSGAALQLPVYLQAVARKREVSPDTVGAEYFYATRRGNFARSGIEGREVLTDDEYGEALRTITAGIEAGRFFPYPGEPRGNRGRPNCTYCDYLSVCSTDVDARFDHKKRLDQGVVRDFLQLQARR